MRVRLIAVGGAPPRWIDDGFADYAARLPRGWGFTLTEIAPAKRARTGSPARWLDDEAGRVLAALPDAAAGVALAVDGSAWDTAALTRRLDAWQHDGRDRYFIIGGPDGLAARVLTRCDARWSLSPLTFPHMLVRVMLVEQLYRAWSLLAGHPYHRV